VSWVFFVGEKRNKSRSKTVAILRVAKTKGRKQMIFVVWGRTFFSYLDSLLSEFQAKT